MEYTYEVTAAQHNVEQAALSAILADQYAREEDPHADASSEHADERLALAARDLVRAVDESDRPIGWDTDPAEAAADAAANA